MAQSSKLRDGRTYSVNIDGIARLKREYIVVNDYVEESEGFAFKDVPKIGTAHPADDNLIVVGYDVREGEGADKRTLRVTVNYEHRAIDASGSGGVSGESSVEAWGWSSGSEEKEFIEDITGKAVVNSAGDAFESVPQISTFSPTFKKVVKTVKRQSGAMAFNCKVNKQGLEIGDMKCAENTLFCTVEEERLFGDAQFNYRYTINLKYKSNMVVIGDSGDPKEIGWNIAVTDSGMRDLDDNGRLQIITTVTDGSRQPMAVTSPELLDGSGHRVTRSPSGTPPRPFNLKFTAYEGVDFPNWFTAEPALPAT